MVNSFRAAFGFPLNRGEHTFTTYFRSGLWYVDRDTVEDWRDVVCRATGLEPVLEPAPEQLGGHRNGGIWEYFSHEVLEEVWRPRNEYLERREAVLEAFAGVSVETTGEREEASYFVVVRQPDPGNAVFEPLANLTVSPEQTETLRRFCRALGVQYQEPSWFLVWSENDEDDRA